MRMMMMRRMMLVASLLLAMLASAASAVRVNNFDQNLNYRCPTGQSVTYMSSYHNNNREDRVWDVTCSYAGQGYTNNVVFSPYPSWFDYRAYFDYSCPSNYALEYLYSYHSNWQEDRLWRLGCRRVNGARLLHCGSSGYRNNFDGHFSYSVASNEVYTGFHSYYSSPHRDRRFSARFCDVECDLDQSKYNAGSRTCASLGTVQISGNYVNNFQQSSSAICAAEQTFSSMYSYFSNGYTDRRWRLACSEPGLKGTYSYTGWSSATYGQLRGPFNYVCPNGHVLTGMRSSYVAGSQDRVYSYRCARIENVETTSCYWASPANTYRQAASINPNVGANIVIRGIRAWFAWTYSDRAWAPYICTLACASGTVRVPSGECKGRICPQLSLTNGAVSGDCDGVFNNQCSYASCNTGYRLSQNNVARTCQADGTWTGTAPTCEPITCPRITDNLAVLSGSCSGNYGDVCRYVQCVQGHLLVGGTATRTCGDNGWSGSAPTCEPQSCGSRPPVANAQLLGNCNGNLDDDCTIRCNAGFVLRPNRFSSTSTTSTCAFDQSSGQPAAWTNADVTCEPVSCGSLSFPNGVLTGACDGSYTNQCTYSECDREYTWASGSGVTTRTCRVAGNDGQWTGTAPSCQRVYCPSGPTGVTNGRTVGSCSSTNNLYGQCSMSCNTGYWPGSDGSTTIRCQLDAGGHSASWNTNFASCKEVRCPVLTIKNGVTSGACAGYASRTCTYQRCNNGYRLSSYGDRQRTCVQTQGTAAWSGSEKSCLEVITTSPGRSFDVQCEDGQAIGGIYGNRDGFWFVTVLGYEFVCLPAGDPDAKRIYTRSTAVHRTQDTFSFSCPEGNYAISGIAASRNGATSRTWTYECSIVAGANLVDCTESSDTFNIKDDFSYSVPQGELLVGISNTVSGGSGYRYTTCKVECRESDGYYETAPGTCERLMCPSVEFTNGITGGDCEGRIGDVCRYEGCSLGFELSSAGDATRTCEIVDGEAQWSGAAKVCNELATTAAPTTTDVCTGLRRSLNADTCKERCNAQDQDSTFFRDYNGCTHVCTCGCHSDYRIAKNEAKCEAHCNSIDESLVASFHDKYDGCRGVCLCLQPDAAPGAVDAMQALPAQNSDSELLAFPFARFGYDLAAHGALTGVGTPQRFDNAYFNNAAIIDIIDVLTPLQCMQACDAQADCDGVHVERVDADSLACRLLNDLGALVGTSTRSVSLRKTAVEGSQDEAMAQAAGTLDVLAGNGATAFVAPEGSGGSGNVGTDTGLNQAGALSQLGPRFLLVPLISDHRLLLINAFDDTYEVLAGTGAAGHSGVGGAASDAQLNRPTAAVADIYGNIYIAEEGNHRVSRIDATSGVLSVVVGTGKAGHRGMGGDGAAAQINEPRGLALDAYGRLYISDQANHVIYRYDTQSGVITVLAGTPEKSGFKGEDGLASSALLHRPTGIAAHPDNSQLFVADTQNNRIREINLVNGRITTTAGAGPAGDGAGVIPDTAGSAALFNNPEGVDVSADGQFVVVADTLNHALRVIDISTDESVVYHVLGSGHRAFNGNDNTPRKTRLNTPTSVLFTNMEGAISFVDQGNRRVRRLWGGVGCFGCTSLPVRSCTASSSYNADYACENAFDGVWADGAGNAWATKGEGVGASITFNFERSVRISQFRYQQRNSASEWFRQMRLTFSDDSEQIVTFDQVQGPVTVTLERTGVVRSVTFTAEAVFTTINNGFNEVQFFGTEE